MTDSVWSAQTALPYPLRSLADSGANLLFGSDAPVSPLDPWAAMAAGVHRTRGGREPWRPDQGLSAAIALAASTAGGSLTGSALEPGGTADLVVVDRDPLTATDPELRTTRAAATILAGRLTHIDG